MGTCSSNKNRQNYQEHQMALQCMGFTNEAKNMEALRARNGNLNDAIQYLLDNDDEPLPAALPNNKHSANQTVIVGEMAMVDYRAVIPSAPFHDNTMSGEGSNEYSDEKSRLSDDINVSIEDDDDFVLELPQLKAKKICVNNEEYIVGQRLLITPFFNKLMKIWAIIIDVHEDGWIVVKYVDWQYNNENTEKLDVANDGISVDVRRRSVIRKCEQYIPAISNKYLWKYKRMECWTNGEIINWIKCMNLDTEYSEKILSIIEMNECNGEDIIELQCLEDISQSFEITDNYSLCKVILKQITGFKPNLKGEDDRIRINILENVVSKTDTIKTIKNLYQTERGIDLEIDHIHLKYNKMELCDDKTLQEYGIENEKYLIEVEFDDVFAIHIYAQGHNLTLNQKVSKQCKIYEIKQMYKQQSGVHANMDDIQFYKQKKLLYNNTTLQLCGIVDDKHLITVKFEADGGGRTSLN